MAQCFNGIGVDGGIFGEIVVHVLLSQAYLASEVSGNMLVGNYGCFNSLCDILCILQLLDLHEFLDNIPL